MSLEATPVVPHLAAEFYTWIWWTSETKDGLFSFSGEVGDVELWVDERLAFRNPEEARVSAVMTGENPSTALESRAALLGGKVLQELRIGFRRDDREYFVTLKGPSIEIAQAKTPSLEGEQDDAQIFDRMFVYEELNLVLGALFNQFATIRASDDWNAQVIPALRSWIKGDELESELTDALIEIE